jgi:tetratricopeptide (TPR) repeat protein
LIRVGEEIRIPDPDAVRCPPGEVNTGASGDHQERGFGSEAASEEVDSVTVYLEQGIELFEEKKFEEALGEFKKVLTARPKDGVARDYSCRSSFEIAMTHFGNGEYLEARDRFKESLDHQGDCMKCEFYLRKSEDLYKETHYKKGMQHYGREQLTEAIMEWEMVRRLDANYKRVEDYIQKAKDLLNKLEDLKMELEEKRTSAEEIYRRFIRT